ncbi:Cof-type HAD-IIB family hydrolase [Thermohalobacter berrensis]|uniref:Haloacid dehalogenase n=1 Tax=Thermohalobacter berrensis TaxID=99594 RepID=A0A419SV37_9FIRM|nr:Cof-type HAD-IIB family hydrolase [Thermohalobacter berrensis]RKD29092.1 haloacid dehalogenase [Thermohalobacter berrensis]
MAYKLIAVDMDGTLLNSNKEVSSKNKNALKVATEKGIQVVITTGRIFTSARYYAKLLGLITPIISNNGAYICEYHRNNVLYENPIRNYELKEVIKDIEEEGMYYHFYGNDTFYTKELDYTSKELYEWNKEQKPGDKINIEVLENPLNFIEEKDPDIYKLVVIDENQDKLKYIRQKLSINDNIEIVSSWSNNVEVMNKGVSKGSALKELCKIFNIKREEVIAIGDHQNDLSMIEFAGTGIAMGNAEDEIKKKAKYITDTNDNDGVAKALKELVF